MAKVKNKDFIIGVNDNITFIDQYNNEHIIIWDNVNERYLFVDGGIEAESYKNATNSHVQDRNPLPTDIDYLIPTIWINSVSLRYFILRRITGGVADWQEMASGTIISEDPRLTINDGTTPPVSASPYDMWIILE